MRSQKNIVNLYSSEEEEKKKKKKQSYIKKLTQNAYLELFFFFLNSNIKSGSTSEQPFSLASSALG